MISISDAAALAAAQAIADKSFDGHMTIMKFTTGWRVLFGTQPESRTEISAMPFGKTLAQALAKAIEQQAE